MILGWENFFLILPIIVLFTRTFFTSFIGEKVLKRVFVNVEIQETFDIKKEEEFNKV